MILGDFGTGQERQMSAKDKGGNGKMAKKIEEYVRSIPDFPEKGIIFSMIAGADERTCARIDSRHVFYPIFGTPDLDESVIRDAIAVLVRYVKVLSPDAEIRTGII